MVVVCMETAATAWAEETFCRADLGDRRLGKRLTRVAAAAAARPSGTVTGSLQTSAEKEGAFRFIENDRVDPGVLTAGMCESTALRWFEHARVMIPVDQTDLTFRDRKKIRGLGPNCQNKKTSFRSIQVMNSMALDESGVPIGLLDQPWWARAEKKVSKKQGRKRKPQQRETWQWLNAFHAAKERMDLSAPDCRPMFVADRGADYGHLLKWAHEHHADVTVRAKHNRTIRHKSRTRKLLSTIRRQSVCGRIDLSIPVRADRKARTARCEVRFIECCELTLENQSVRYSAVSIREIGFIPFGQPPIQWTLLTNCEVML